MPLLLLVGCASLSGPPADSPSSSPSQTAVITPSIVPAAEFCAADLPSGATQQPLAAPEGITLNSVWLGSGTTTAVLLHQTDGNGLCGFAFFGDYLAQRGIRVVLVDICGYGQSYCMAAAGADDPAEQVRTVTDAARAAGAKRVVLVGASMGGSFAVTAAQASRADAIVDLSGPAAFGGVCDIARDAANVTMPALFAFASTDPQDQADVRKALPMMPSKQKTFRRFDTGHGYELLRDLSSGDFSPFAQEVADFISQGETR